MTKLMTLRISKLAVVSLLFGLVPIGYFCIFAFYQHSIPLQNIALRLPFPALFYALVLAAIAPFASIILGHVARRKILKKSSEIKGLGVATIGLVMGYVGIVFVVVLVYTSFFTPPRRYRLPRATDEGIAINILQNIHEAFQSCCKVRSSGRLPETLRQLQQMADNPQLINDRVAEGGYGEYNYAYHLRSTNNDGKLDGFEAVAEPEMPDSDGRRFFYIDETGIVRVESNKRATGKSPPITQDQIKPGS